MWDWSCRTWVSERGPGGMEEVWDGSVNGEREGALWGAGWVAGGWVERASKEEGGVGSEGGWSGSACGWGGGIGGVVRRLRLGRSKRCGLEADSDGAEVEASAVLVWSPVRQYPSWSWACSNDPMSGRSCCCTCCCCWPSSCWTLTPMDAAAHPAVAGLRGKLRKLHEDIPAGVIGDIEAEGCALVA